MSIAVGDVVELKSGSGPMVVEAMTSTTCSVVYWNQQTDTMVKLSVDSAALSKIEGPSMSLIKEIQDEMEQLSTSFSLSERKKLEFFITKLKKRWRL
jgi:uncharacterized protein YodC (DUF2158 family)